MNVLITGGAGFPGGKRLRALVARGTLPGAGGAERDIARLRVGYRPDPFIEGIVYGRATRFDTPRAQAMGFRAHASFREVVEAFIEDELGGRFAAGAGDHT